MHIILTSNFIDIIKTRIPHYQQHHHQRFIYELFSFLDSHEEIIISRNDGTKRLLTPDELLKRDTHIETYTIATMAFFILHIFTSRFLSLLLVDITIASHYIRNWLTCLPKGLLPAISYPFSNLLIVVYAYTHNRLKWFSVFYGDCPSSRLISPSRPAKTWLLSSSLPAHNHLQYAPDRLTLYYIVHDP